MTLINIEVWQDYFIDCIYVDFEDCSNDTLCNARKRVKLPVFINKENLPAKAGIKDVKVFFNDQRNHLLLYLPAALNMGELLHDPTLDDNTNKMEGPVSNLIKNIGSTFSNPVTAEEIKKWSRYTRI